MGGVSVARRRSDAWATDPVPKAGGTGDLALTDRYDASARGLPERFRRRAYTAVTLAGRHRAARSDRGGNFRPL